MGRVGNVVYIKHTDGSWYRACIDPGSRGDSEETVTAFGRVLYKASPLAGLEVGAIIAGSHALDVAVMGRNGMWYGTWDGGLTSEEIYTAFDEDVTIVRRKG